MIQSAFTGEDAAFVDEADLILLAGGDVCEGRDIMSRNGLKEAVQSMGGMPPGAGVPVGGRLLYHPDKVIEPIRYPVQLVEVKANAADQTLLAPLAHEDVGTALRVC